MHECMVYLPSLILSFDIKIGMSQMRAVPDSESWNEMAGGAINKLGQTCTSEDDPEATCNPRTT